MQQTKGFSGKLISRFFLIKAKAKFRDSRPSMNMDIYNMLKEKNQIAFWSITFSFYIFPKTIIPMNLKEKQNTYKE